MSVRVIGKVPQPHRCDLPIFSNKEDEHRGEVVVCRTCASVYVCDPIPWERVWRRMRPWPFDRRVRRLLVRAARGVQ